jgi:hypothetical protein
MTGAAAVYAKTYGMPVLVRLSDSILKTVTGIELSALEKIEYNRKGRQHFFRADRRESGYRSGPEKAVSCRGQLRIRAGTAFRAKGKRRF